jgi:hypothetical protein
VISPLLLPSPPVLPRFNTHFICWSPAAHHLVSRVFWSCDYQSGHAAAKGPWEGADSRPIGMLDGSSWLVKEQWHFITSDKGASVKHSLSPAVVLRQ